MVKFSIIGTFFPTTDHYNKEPSEPCSNGSYSRSENDLYYAKKECVMMKKEKVWKIAMTGVFAALSYVVFTFLQFKIWLPGGDATSIHFGNAVCVLGALILGGVYGGIGGAIGMTIGDLLDPVYIVYAPKTFILKFCIGLIAGIIAHKIGKIDEQTDKKQIFKWALLAAIGGLLFNVIFDPLLGYFYKLLILGKPAAEVTLSWNILATSINAVLSTIASVVIYMALRPALQKSGLFHQIKKTSEA